MKAAKLYNFNDIRIEDIPIPEIGPGDALIRTHACGICSGDVMPWYIEKKALLVIGHEPTGEIVETGEGVTSFKPGDRVFTHHHAPCFTCRFCRRGDYVQCETWKNTKIIPGGISEYILIPRINLENDTLSLPDTLSYEDGTLIEPTACVVKALKRAGIRRGDTVLVIGLGFMGQLNVLLARKYGAGKIIGADMVQFRLQKAKELGADEVIDVSKNNLIEALKELTNGEMADVVIVGPNSAEAMKQGIGSTGAGGKVLFFTPAKPDEKLILDPNELYFKDINIITSYSCGPTDTADALEIIESGIVSAEKLVTHRFPIEKTAEAFRLTAEAKDSFKSVIVFE
ncbi:MAG: sorbitol dehydrogenase [Nitrospirae bacterium GWF2_44_13]|nr:MAG: sorbitol dehydrogenase [Nitrospirae bacterium GWF2_44_13]OGW33340.1 MAG: sorbitol dehydrogenase [Nitrospirae bacterium GWD2_44_7]OGW63911.1 MAG: sorbitol dehydrogenase [Nitrospirae bacterium RIFOXYA2_FULL_44_9]HBG93239.1 sorbitol dehydrogenase [Nitrospiraceae bacterium]